MIIVGVGGALRGWRADLVPPCHGDEPAGLHALSLQPSEGGVLLQRRVSSGHLHPLLHAAQTNKCPRQGTGSCGFITIFTGVGIGLSMLSYFPSTVLDFYGSVVVKYMYSTLP